MADLQLGCGEYSVLIQEVGGTEVLAEVAYSSLSYSRLLDEMTSATVVVSSEQDAECIPYLGSLRSWSHEVAIWRDGVEAWAGPVIDPTYHYDGMTLDARDLFAWFERRVLMQDHTFSATDLATIAAAYADDALSQDPTPNIIISTAPTGVLGDRAVQAVLLRRAADEIRELSRTGLDFTAIGRSIRFGGEEVPADPLVTLTEDVFQIEPDGLRLDGLAMGNDIWILGSSGGGVSTPVTGHAGGDSQPLISQVYNEASILDVSSANHAAQTRYELVRDPPFFIRGRLLPEAPISFDKLIPGARVSVRQQVGFRRVEEDMRLLSVEVSAEVSDDGDTEAIDLVLEPLGTVSE